MPDKTWSHRPAGSVGHSRLKQGGWRVLYEAAKQVAAASADGAPGQQTASTDQDKAVTRAGVTPSTRSGGGTDGAAG